MVIVVLTLLPPESVAVTVYDDDEAPVGVPEMMPVVVLKDSPAGKVGLMLKELADPTGEMVGVALVMAVPETPVIVLVEYDTFDTVHGKGWDVRLTETRHLF